MPSSSEPPSPRWFTDTESRRILGRMVELDEKRRSGTSEAELREVALELGVDATLLEQAIAEVLEDRSLVARRETTGDSGGPEVDALLRQDREARRGTDPSPGLDLEWDFGRDSRFDEEWDGRASRVEVLLACAIGLMIFLPWAGASGVDPIPVLATGAISVLLALDFGGPGAFRRYWARNAGLWTGWYLAVSGIAGYFVEPDSSFLLLVGFPVLAGTGAIALFRGLARLHRRTGATPGRGAGGGGRLGRGLLRAGRRLLGVGRRILDRLEGTLDSFTHFELHPG